MTYANIIKQHGKQVMPYRVEYRETFDISAQPIPTRVEYVSDKQGARALVKAAGAKLWNA